MVVADAAVNPSVSPTPSVPAVVVADWLVATTDVLGVTDPAVEVLDAAVSGTLLLGVTVPAVVVADTDGTA